MSLEKIGKLDKSIILSPYFSKLILENLSSVLGSPAKRKSARKEKKGTLEIACGLNPVFYFLNNMQPFVDPVIQQSEDSDVQNFAYTEEYKFEQWELADQSSRGFAVIKNIKPDYTVRVSDLIIIKSKSENNKGVIGLIRWLIIRKGQAYKIGVQILSANAETAAIRACSGSTQDTRFRRALLVNQGTKENVSVITGKGLSKKNREVEIFSNNKTHKTNALALLESTIGFDQFEIEARL
jgi:hypothetical protein